jgi:putative SOS response-associated peptidase YedK
MKIAYRTINARAETVATKPAFRSAYKARRCLIPASGFYEWKRDVEPKSHTISIAATPTPWRLQGYGRPGKGQITIASCTIITTKANQMMAELHNRMPVILDPEDFDWWMTGKTEQVAQLLRPYRSDALHAYPISRRVNNPRNDGPELLEWAIRPAHP